MKRLVALLVLLWAIVAGATNITNYPVVTTFNASDWFLLSSVPNMTNYNLPGNYVASTSDLNTASNALWQQITNTVTTNITYNNLYTTNFYSSNITATNVYITTNYVDYSHQTNTYVTYLYTTNFYSITNYVDTLTATNGITNLSLTANTILKADAGKRITSVANGTGVLTNNGAGVFGWASLAIPTANLWTNYQGLWPVGSMQDLRLGWLAFDSSTTTGAGQVALGLGALSDASGAADSSVFIGASAGYQQSATANAATFIGKDAATNNSGTLNTTVGVGHGAFAGFGGTTAFDAVAIGNQALNLFTGTDAVGTVAIGAYSAARSSAPFGLSVSIGDTAGYMNSGAVDNSVAIGNQALANNSGAFQQGVAIGYNAQINNVTSLTNVVALGAVASVTKNNQMALGKNITDYIFNNVNYTFPGASALGSLTNDGSGNLGWFDASSRTNFNGITVTNTVIANQTEYYTNLCTMAPDFSKGYCWISTNAAFTFLLPIGIDATGTKAQTTVMIVTNSSAAAILATAPANVHVVPGSVMYITNATAYTFFLYPLIGTNVYGVPLF